MKLGVTPWDFTDRTARGLTEQARTAQSFGYDSFWLPESHFSPHAIPDPLMLLAAVAAGTNRIRLATTSYLLPLRNPLQAAEQVAVLDRLSEGRLTLGVGRGYAPAMLKAFNVVPSEKRKLFESCLEAMQTAWSGEPVSLREGDDPVVLDPLPVQKPHPPIWVAAFGPKALAQAGRLGLPYLASPVESLATLEANYARHTEAVIEAGHVELDIIPVMRTVFVSNNSSEAHALRERIHQEAQKTGRLAKDAATDDWCIIGDEAYVRDKFDEYRERLRVSHLVATRMRIPGVDKISLERSVEKVAEIAGL